jgi:hypothetical protein
MHPGVVLYNSVYAIRWPGLDAQRFKLAWQRLVDSCDALRSVFEEVNGVPEQRVVAPFTTEVDCIDLSRDKSSENTLNKCIADRLKCPPSRGPTVPFPAHRACHILKLTTPPRALQIKVVDMKQGRLALSHC